METEDVSPSHTCLGAKQKKSYFTGEKSLELPIILKNGENPALLKVVLQEVLGNTTQGNNES